MVDLEPIHARLRWADDAVAHLQSSVERYSALPPFQTTKAHWPDGQTVERAELIQDPPIEISLLLSDISHHLRATLDNLVGAVREGGSSQQSAFPITSDPAKFEQLATADRYLEGVPAWAVEAVRLFQPFPDNLASWAGGRLLILNELAQLDRHRALALRAALVEADYVEVQISDHSIPIEFRQDGPRAAEVIYGGETRVRSHFNVRVLIAEPSPLLNGEETLPLARNLSNIVQWVVGDMERRVREAFAT
jgi:hypothetical protein